MSLVACKKLAKHTPGEITQQLKNCLCIPKTPFSDFQRNVTLSHSDRVVKPSLSFIFLNVADFKGIRRG
jgi:hypothetical protein